MTLSSIEVSIDLPFFLRLEKPVSVLYEDVCKESPIPELSGRNVEIVFSKQSVTAAGRSGASTWQSTVGIKVNTSQPILDQSVKTFAISNCLEILNRIVTSYQAVTGEVTNADFIVPVGLSYMQLFAEIRVDGRGIRDIWPSQKLTKVPLSTNQNKGFERYLTGQDDFPLSRLFFMNALLSLERGQYPLAILQAATAVELRITQFVSSKLKAAGWSDEAMKPYERLTLGRKVQIPQTDPRSLETYFNGIPGFAPLYSDVRSVLTPLRNSVAHRGHLASQEEAKRVVEMAGKFLKIVSLL
jgi:hypothetical protein